jgi:hypothetical protein
VPSPSTTHSVVSYRLCVVFREYCCSFHTFTFSLHCPGSRHGKKLLFDPSVLCCVCYDPHSPCDFTCQVDGCDTGYHATTAPVFEATSAGTNPFTDAKA